MLVPCFLPARPVGRRREQRKGGEVDGDSATKIMPSGSPAVATSNLHCYLCKITIVLIESKKNQTSHFVVATNACLPGPRMETPVAVASTLAILTTVTAVARCKILTLPMPTACPPNGQGAAFDNSERRAECVCLSGWTSH